jgi:hypothetical protein
MAAIGSVAACSASTPLTDTLPVGSGRGTTSGWYSSGSVGSGPSGSESSGSGTSDGGSYDGGDGGIDGGDAGADGGDGGDGAPHCDQAQGGCNSVSNCGARIFAVLVSGNAPAPQGGTIVEGTYVLTDFRVFTGPGGANRVTTAWFRETFQLHLPYANGGVAPADASVETAAGDASLDAAPDGSVGQGGPLLFDDVIVTDQMSLTTSTAPVSVAPPAQLTLGFTCPSNNMPLMADYTALAGALVLFIESPGIGRGELTYTKM